MRLKPELSNLCWYALNYFIKKEINAVYVVPDHQWISLPVWLTSLLLVCGVRGQLDNRLKGSHCLWPLTPDHFPSSWTVGQLSISPLPVSVSWTILPVCFCLFMIYVTLFVLWMIISSRELVSQLFLCFHRQLARRTRMIDASCLVLQWFCATLNQSFIYLVAALLSALLKCGWRKHWMTSWSRVMYIYLIMTCLGKKLLPFIN